MSHRLHMARAAKAAGYDVHVVTNVNAHGSAIESEGFRLHAVKWRRGSLKPLVLIDIVRQVRKRYRAIAPDLANQVTLQSAIIGSLAGVGLPFARLNLITGLGFLFASRSPTARLLRPVVAWLIWFFFNQKDTAVLVENNDDRRALRSMGVAGEQIFRIQGSGVDTSVLRALPEPDGPVTMAFAGRLLDQKGIRTVIKAHELLIRQGSPVRFVIAGAPDHANPSSIPEVEIETWRRRPGMVVLGHVADIREVWKIAHIAVLPSRGGEGVPQSLIEAAACGRALIASDVPGCRDIARPGHNAILLPPDDPAALVEAVDRLARNSDLRRQFGAAGRRLVEDEFSSERVRGEILALYDQLLNRASERRGQRTRRANVRRNGEDGITESPRFHPGPATSKPHLTSPTDGCGRVGPGSLVD